MIYPIGYSSLSLRFERSRDSRVIADGVTISDVDGWIDVPLPFETLAAGTPHGVSVQLRVEPLASGRWFLVAQCIVAGEQRFEALFDLMDSHARAWLPALRGAVDAEISRRVAAARGVAERVPAVVLTAAAREPGASDPGTGGPES